MSLPYFGIFSFFCIAGGNAAAIIYFRWNPLKSELFERFIPCMYLNAATFGILAVFDYHFVAFMLGQDIAQFVHFSMICDVVHTSVRTIMFLEIFYTLYLISELFTQRLAWRVWFKLGYCSAIVLFLAIILIRHFWISQGSCYRATDSQLFVDICIFFEVTGFIATLVSLVVIKLDDEQKFFRFVLLIATVIELPECFIEVAFDRWHPIHAPGFMYFRMCAYGLFQLIFVAAVFQVGRKIKDQPNQHEMETAFGNPAGEDVYL